MEKAIEIEAATLMHLGRTKTNIPTFDKFKPQYLEFCERQRGYKYKRNVVNLLSNNFGQLRLNQIQTYNLEKYQSKMLIDGISPATINRRIATIKHTHKTNKTSITLFNYNK
jgi:site-specific recombinase XerD